MRRFILLFAALILFWIGSTQYAAHAQPAAVPNNQTQANTLEAAPNLSLRQAWAKIKTNHMEPETIGFVIGYIAVIVVLFWFASTSDMLRDNEPQDFGGIIIGPNETNNLRRPFSLAQSQMAWWFAIVLAGYLFLFLTTGDIPSLNGQALTLMGIGTGTALGATLVEQNKANKKLDRFKGLLTQISANPTPDNVAELRSEARKLAQDLSSENFLSDILTDINGISLHRFQALVWTIALGAIFIIEVVVKKKMPEFDSYTLGILGISSGTYLGFKIPEIPA